MDMKISLEPHTLIHKITTPMTSKIICILGIHVKINFNNK